LEPDASAGQTLPPQPAVRPSRARRRLLIALTAVIALAIAAIGAFMIYRRGQQPDPLPQSVTRQVTFPLYYPTRLPAGFRLEPESASATNQVVTFAISAPEGKQVVISQQPTPSDFDFENFYLNSLFGAKEVITPLGKAVIGQINDDTFASIVTDETWIIINAPAGLPADQMQRLIQAFAPAPN